MRVEVTTSQRRQYLLELYVLLAKMVNETAEDMSVLTTEPEGVRFTLKFILLYHPLAAKFIDVDVFTKYGYLHFNTTLDI